MLWVLAVMALTGCVFEKSSSTPKITRYHDLVTVDYTKSIKELVESGNYDVVEEGISDANFNVRGFVGVSKPNFELVRFNKGMRADDVLANLDVNGLRAATIQELLAFGALLPDMQRGFSIYALGSSCRQPWSVKKQRSVPLLRSRGDCRTVELQRRDFLFKWSEECWFLAVRK